MTLATIWLGDSVRPGKRVKVQTRVRAAWTRPRNHDGNLRGPKALARRTKSRLRAACQKGMRQRELYVPGLVVDFPQVKPGDEGRHFVGELDRYLGRRGRGLNGLAPWWGFNGRR